MSRNKKIAIGMLLVPVLGITATLAETVEAGEGSKVKYRYLDESGEDSKPGTTFGNGTLSWSDDGYFITDYKAMEDTIKAQAYKAELRLRLEREAHKRREAEEARRVAQAKAESARLREQEAEKSRQDIARAEREEAQAQARALDHKKKVAKEDYERRLAASKLQKAQADQDKADKLLMAKAESDRRQQAALVAKEVERATAEAKAKADAEVVARAAAEAKAQKLAMELTQIKTEAALKLRKQEDEISAMKAKAHREAVAQSTRKAQERARYIADTRRAERESTDEHQELKKEKATLLVVPVAHTKSAVSERPSVTSAPVKMKASVLSGLLIMVPDTGESDESAEPESLIDEVGEKAVQSSNLGASNGDRAVKTEKKPVAPEPESVPFRLGSVMSPVGTASIKVSTSNKVRVTKTSLAATDTQAEIKAQIEKAVSEEKAKAKAESDRVAQVEAARAAAEIAAIKKESDRVAQAQVELAKRIEADRVEASRLEAQRIARAVAEAKSQAQAEAKAQAALVNRLAAQRIAAAVSQAKREAEAKRNAEIQAARDLQASYPTIRLPDGTWVSIMDSSLVEKVTLPPEARAPEYKMPAPVVPVISQWETKTPFTDELASLGVVPASKCQSGSSVLITDLATERADKKSLNTFMAGVECL